MPDEPTLGELMRRLTDLQQTVSDLVHRLEQGYVRVDSVAPLERRVASLESSVTWVVRLVIGAVIAALLALVIVQGGKG